MNTDRTLWRTGLVCLLLSVCAVAGCGASGDEVEVSETRADGSKMSADDKQAADFLTGKILERWVKGPDGWTTQYQMFNVLGQPVEGTPTLLYRQYRQISFTISPGTLTEAMQLNGTDYRAEAVFKESPGRWFRTEATYEGPQGWGNWQDGMLAYKRIAIERRKGQWIMSDDELLEGIKPTGAVPTGT